MVLILMKCDSNKGLLYRNKGLLNSFILINVIVIKDFCIHCKEWSV